MVAPLFISTLLYSQDTDFSPEFCCIITHTTAYDHSIRDHILQRPPKDESLDPAWVLSLNKTRNTKDEILASSKQNILP